jgi:hypothetical protein
MKLISPTKGLKVRSNAVAKLRDATVDWENATGEEMRGMIIANDDGSFTPAVILNPKASHLIRSLAEAGIYVIG